VDGDFQIFGVCGFAGFALVGEEDIDVAQDFMQTAFPAVIGIIVGTVAKAYPAAILSQHGLVEDQTPSGPIAITW